jgi:hypothetical protein
MRVSPGQRLGHHLMGRDEWPDAECAGQPPVRVPGLPPRGRFVGKTTSPGGQASDRPRKMDDPRFGRVGPREGILAEGRQPLLQEKSRLHGIVRDSFGDPPRFFEGGHGWGEGVSSEKRHGSHAFPQVDGIGRPANERGKGVAGRWGARTLAGTKRGWGLGQCPAIQAGRPCPDTDRIRPCSP